MNFEEGANLFHIKVNILWSIQTVLKSDWKKNNISLMKIKKLSYNLKFHILSNKLMCQKIIITYNEWRRFDHC